MKFLIPIGMLWIPISAAARIVDLRDGPWSSEPSSVDHHGVFAPQREHEDVQEHEEAKARRSEAEAR